MSKGCRWQERELVLRQAQEEVIRILPMRREDAWDLVCFKLGLGVAAFKRLWTARSFVSQNES